MQEKMVSVRDGMFSTQVREDGTGEPLVFLHGAGGAMWDPMLTALAKTHRVIAPVHPGFGESTGDENLLDIFDLIYYYLDFLDTLGLRDLPLIGHSFGGMIAAELAAVQPERFRKLVLIAPVGLWNPEYPGTDIFGVTPQEMMRAMLHDPEGPAAKGMGAMPNPAEQPEAFVAFMVERAKASAATAKYLWPIWDKGLKKRIHRISAPTLIVWGQSDGIAPVQYGSDFRNLIKGSRLEVIPEAGHAPQLEQPERTIQVVADFLR